MNYGKYFIPPVIQTADRLGLGAKISPPKVVDSSQKIKKLAPNSPMAQNRVHSSQKLPRAYGEI